MPRILPMILCLAVAIVGRAAYPADSVDGFLCCNAFSDGEYISDLNAPGADRHRVRVGSPVHVSGVGKHKLKVDIENKKQQIANDYSREIGMSEFLTMSLGYPTADDVANLSSRTWLYWITDHVQYRVNFDGNDLVADIENVPDARSQILIE